MVGALVPAKGGVLPLAQTVGDFLVERLHAWGVRKIFGYPGDGINGMFGALNRADGKIEFIQARHEEMAAFMASAYAKFTGELGVCIATSGPGASHLITGLYDARLDRPWGCEPVADHSGDRLSHGRLHQGNGRVRRALESGAGPGIIQIF